MFACRSSRACVVAIAVLASLVAARNAQAVPVDVTTGTIGNGVNNLSGIVTISHGAWSTYTGEGYVVGSGSPNAASSYTLANKDGGQFLINSGANAITMTLSKPLYAISFDYEIFPNGQMPNGAGKNSSTPGWPDFVFLADGQTVFTAYGVMPNADPLGGTNGFSYSPNSGAGMELAPQFIGSSGMIEFPGGVTQLEFLDWPPTIGVNNLHFFFSPQVDPVPEPATLAVFACGAAAVFAFRRRITSGAGRTSCGRTL
jgi:hypothetical protein